jgi:transposase
LDLLADRKEQLSEHIFNKQKLYGKTDVVFFDVTTLYFESQKADDLRKFGFSKDCKFNEVQVVLSMVIDSEGRPLAYEIFPGNTFEGTTLIPNLLKLRKKYCVGKVIIVADRGISSQANLDAVKASGFEYVVGVRLRSAGKAVKEEALDPAGYMPLGTYGGTEDDVMKYKIVRNKESSWVALWSSKRARKDRKDRIRLVERAKEMLESGNLKDKRGAKKYIYSSKSQHGLDIDKIEHDALWDGHYALSCSDASLGPEEIVHAYHGIMVPRIQTAKKEK